MNARCSGGQLAVVAGQVLDRADVRAVGLDGEHHAALDGLAVELDGAGAAVAGVAADVRAREVEIVADEVHEQAPWPRPRARRSCR